ncbi:hypothetical protein [Nocardioides flavescens]|uniref:Uncharacterized protein n=1 Tax=Nocardioides flavescens TaxID=2691959 RepID=A0A6L7F0F2_9ACTN|nr:hypothetical protein [Nocardioides flavescens]MXG88244.1 hypothetical protein [Nocardioides flavescens]
MSLSSTALADAVPALIPMDVPVGWSDPDQVSIVHALLVLGGIPVLLFILIGLAIYAPALARGERIAPGAQPMQNQWLGGPRGDAGQLSAGSSTSTASADAESQTGGASGRW